MKIEKTTIKGWIEAAREARVLGAEGLDLTTAAGEAAAALLYPQSLKQRNGTAFALLKMPGISRGGPAFSWDRVLGIFGPPDAFAVSRRGTCLSRCRWIPGRRG